MKINIFENYSMLNLCLGKMLIFQRLLEVKEHFLTLDDAFYV